MKNIVRICALFCLGISGIIRSAGSELTLFDRMTKLNNAAESYEANKKIIQAHPTEIFFAQQLALLPQPGVGVFNELPPYNEFTAEILLRERNDFGQFSNPSQDLLELLPEHIQLNDLKLIVAEFVSLVETKDSQENDHLYLEIAALSKQITEKLKNKELVKNQEKKQKAVSDNDDYLSDTDDEIDIEDSVENIKQSFSKMILNWLYEFGEPTIAYACSIVLPYVLSQIHTISNENMIAGMAVGLATVHIVRENILRKKIAKVLSTSALIIGIIAYSIHAQK